MSAVLLKITDATFGGKILNEIIVSLAAERVTVKDIIEARVNQEVNAYNTKGIDFYHGLVQPNDAEVTLNGFKLKKYMKVDAEKQVYTALDAFQNNGFFVLVDNKQAESLDEEVIVTSESTVSFLKLTPLVGG